VLFWRLKKGLKKAVRIGPRFWFDIQASEDQANFLAPGVYLVGREFAGSERGSAQLGASPTFDLVVIDEAHEIFAGLHKRYERDGTYDETSDQALVAHRVRGFLRSTPVLLLTATPMQNSLVELWGLVQYVEPTGTLLGDIATFRKVFCEEDDRTLLPGQAAAARIRTKYRSQTEETVCRSERLAADSGVNRGRSVIPTAGSFLTRPQVRRLR
jgi:hypothetical protein